MTAALAMAPDQSSDALFAEVYDRLKAMAARQRARNHTPGAPATTELVHELYLRMGAGADKRFGDQAQFFAYAARALRHILIDAARSAMQVKAGGNQLRVSLNDPAVGGVSMDPVQALHLDAALRALGETDERAARVVELHWFGGVALAQIANLLGLTSRTIERDWRFARAFLAAHAHE